MKTHPIFSSAAFVNKRMKDLFVAQAEKPEELAEVNLTRLTPRQRALLITDGTVTRFPDGKGEFLPLAPTPGQANLSK